VQAVLSQIPTLVNRRIMSGHAVAKKKIESKESPAAIGTPNLRAAAFFVLIALTIIVSAFYLTPIAWWGP